MRALTISGTDIVTTPLGLGCAGLYREPSARGRRQLLEVAYAAGIRHFDVAPMYGLGTAERELGRFVADRRDRIVIATKFGIEPSAAGTAIGRVQGPVRRLLATAPSLRRRARTAAPNASAGVLGPVLYRDSGFDSASARASLERSLRELQTDYVDILLLHEPTLGARFDDVCTFLESAKSLGSIRTWGVAGEWYRARSAVRALPVAVPVLQLPYDLSVATSSETVESSSARITFGVIERGVRKLVRYLESDAARRRQWLDAIGVDCAIQEVAVQILLGQAARVHDNGVVLFSSTREEHLTSAVGAFTGSTGTTQHAVDVLDSLISREGSRIWPEEAVSQ